MFKFSEELQQADQVVQYDFDQGIRDPFEIAQAQTLVSIAKSLEVIAEKGIHLPQLNGFEVETIPGVQGITRVKVRTEKKQ